MPDCRPKRKQGYEGKPRRCVWSKAEHIKRLQYQLRYLRHVHKAALDKIKYAAQGKEEGKVQWMAVLWLVRVCLAQPLTSCRALAQAHLDFIGSGGGRKGCGARASAVEQCRLVDQRQPRKDTTESVSRPCCEEKKIRADTFWRL